jgi:CheY-like chemotaxis protein
VLKDTVVVKKMNKPHLGPFKGLRVLVAEDNPINKFLIVKILKDWEVNPDVVENGKDALDKLRESDYDLILMDTFMPVMNGLDAIKLIREGFIKGKENTPIITFSAAVLETDKQTAIDAGANDVVSKPFELEVLHEKITKYSGIAGTTY